MHFTTPTALLILLAGTAVSTPIVKDISLEKRDDSFCNYQEYFFYYDWQVGIANGQRWGLCGGLLDNLCGACGVITDWTCNEDDQSTTYATFKTTIGCSANQVGGAIWTATDPHLSGVTCYN